MNKLIRKYISFNQIENTIHAVYYSMDSDFPGLIRKGKCKFSEERWEKILPNLIKQKPLSKKWLTCDFEEYIEPPAETDLSSIIHLTLKPELLEDQKLLLKFFRNSY